MADPFSVAASAAGIVSLGLEVCKGIVQYCDAWRGADDEVEAVTLKAQQLSTTLKQLDQVLDSASILDRDIADSIRGIVLANNTRIVKLRGKLSKCDFAAGQNVDIHAKVQATVRKFKYPFIRSSLLDMRDVLGELQSNLHTALHVAQLQQSSAMSKHMILLGNMQSAVLAKLEEHSCKIEQMTLMIKEHPNDIVRKPSLLRSLCDEQQRLGIELSPSNGEQGIKTDLVRKRTRFPACACSRFRQDSRREHVPGCAFHQPPTRSRNIVKKFRYCSKWLGFCVDAVMSIKTGAGGFAFAPMLRFSAVVPCGSGAFGLVRSRPMVNGTHDELSTFYSDMIFGLQQLFDEGKANPTDVEAITGCTLLHSAIESFCSWTSPGFELYPLRVVRYLVMKGCPVDEPSWGYRGTPIQLTFRSSTEIDNTSMTSYLIESGAVIKEDYDLPQWGLEYLRIHFLDYEAAFLYSDVVKAIVRRSEIELCKFIESYRFSHDFSERLTHLLARAVKWGWAQGVEILLEQGATAKMSMMSDAVSSDSIPIVKLLLEWGSPLNPCLFTLCRSVDMERLLMDELSSSTERLKMPPKMLLLRHYQVRLGLNGCLWENLETELQAEDIHIYRPYEQPILNQLPVFHVAALQIDQMERLCQFGFRNFDGLDDFSDTPLVVFDFHMCNLQHHIKRISWLLGKGARLDKRLSWFDATICHAVSLGLSKSAVTSFLMYDGLPNENDPRDFLRCFETWLDLNLTDRVLLGEILCTEHTDRCVCFCSGSGCTPLSMALRSLLEYYYQGMHYSGMDHRMDPIRTLLGLLIQAAQESGQVAETVIRAFTSNDLGLTHTCCRAKWRKYGYSHPFTRTCLYIAAFDEDDANEIRAEEKSYLDEFEGLLQVLQEDYEALGLPLWDFIQGHWCTRMKEHLVSHGEPVTPEALCSILSLRVQEA